MLVRRLPGVLDYVVMVVTCHKVQEGDRIYASYLPWLSLLYYLTVSVTLANNVRIYRQQGRGRIGTP